jgi:cytochrome c oxidase subunit 1
MFVSGQSIYAGLVFSFLTMVVAVPSAIKMFNWTATLYKGSISFDTPMLYGLGFMGLFLIGGLTGLFLGSIGLVVHLTDTYFVVAHFHYVMVGGQVIAYLGGIHYWWPKMTGKMYSEFWGKISAMLVFVGFNLTFFPQFILGYLGMPRRYASYPPELQVMNIFSTAGASVLGLGMLMPVVYLIHSLFKGQPAGDNPWMLPGLEWRTSSPPPTENFEVMPVVTWEAYEFGEDSGLDLEGARAREAAKV